MSRIEDIKPWTRQSSGTTIEKNKQVPKINDTFFDTDLGVIQYWNGTSWQSDKTVVHYSSQGSSNSFSIGKGSNTSNYSDIVVGNYSTSNGTGYPTVIVGNNSISAGYRNELIGNNINITGSYNVAIGDKSSDSNVIASTGYNTLVGYYSSGVGKYATSIGAYSEAALGSVSVGYKGYTTGFSYDTRIGYHTQNNGAAYGVAVGSSAQLNSTLASGSGYSITIGAYSQVIGATDSISIGAHSTNRVSQTTAINNPIIVRKDAGNVNIVRDFSGTESVIMSSNMTLTTLSSTIFNIPTGCVIIPKEIGIICNGLGTHVPLSFTSPTITVQGSQDGVTYTNITSAIATNLTKTRQFEILNPIAPFNNAYTHIKVSVTTPGVAIDPVTNTSTTYTGRAFIKGIFLEE